MTLRLFAGASYLDLVSAHEVGNSTVFSVFHETLTAIDKRLSMADLDIWDETGLKSLSYGFQYSRSPASPLRGCVEAVDGIAIQIKRSSTDPHPRNYWSRKGMYSIPVQAVANSMYQFQYMSATCTGKTHDSVAFACTVIHRRMNECSDGIIAPWTKHACSNESEGLYRDAFNFHHSSLRIHVKQAFGILFRRWGVLWKPSEFDIGQVPKIISGCMRLSNFCIEHDGVQSLAAVYSADERNRSESAFRTWWVEAATNHDLALNRSRRAVANEMEYLRDHLTDELKSKGYVRPPVRALIQS